MAFIDDFSVGVTGADLTTGTPSGGTAWTNPLGTRWQLQYTAAAITASDSGAGTGNSVYLCDDQGSSDQYAIVKTVSFPYYTSRFGTRLSAGSFTGVGAYHFGTGGAGRRLSLLGDTSGDLLTSQGVSGEWLKVESEGVNHRLLSGGTGGTPVWAQVGSDVSDARISTTTTGAGFFLGGSLGGDYVSYFEAGVLGAAPATLTLTSITPTTGPSTGGTTVTMTGTGFEVGTVPKFNGVDATSVTILSDTELTCVTPAL